MDSPRPAPADCPHPKSKDEVKTLVHWIEAGAPRGSGGDPLVELKRTWPEWASGEPDLIVEIPAFDVRRPASRRAT
jgi:hypothetical protein